VRQSKKGFLLYDSAGQRNGYVDLIRIAEGKLEVHGWSLSDKVTLILGDRRIETVPSIVRHDVAAVNGSNADEKVGFVLKLPIAASPWLLVCQTGNQHFVHEIPGFGKIGTRVAQLRILPVVARSLVRATPEILKWTLHRDDLARAALIARLGLEDIQQITEINPDLFAPSRDGAKMDDQKITIVLPVYDAFEILQGALDRVLRHTDLPWRLVIVEDCSSDRKVRPFLRTWVSDVAKRSDAQIDLIENQENLGFIRSVNRALEKALDYGDHVVLLNSDALVPDGWASRLIRPILTHENVASVTPMSNDAEIFNVPLICKKAALEPGQADRIDAVARRMNPEADLASAPTGVGFCMAMNIEYIRRFPALDVSFGKGYGEEVDWCQKVRGIGGRHLGLPGLFVEHRGGSSFGSVEKQKLVERNNAVIAGRYPRYNSDVQDFIRHDPMSSARLALSIAWAAECATMPLSIYLAHSLGGGAEMYLERRIRSDIETNKAAIVLRVGGPSRWQIECHFADGVNTGLTNDFTLLTQILNPIGSRKLVYSCGVGDRDPATLPDHLLSLKRPADTLEVLVHDYFPVSPSYSLVASTGKYHGVPDEKSTDAAHTSRLQSGRKVSLIQWRRKWRKLLEAAEDITVFSEDSRRLILTAFPGVGRCIRVRPHVLLERIPKVKRPGSKTPVIGVLGNLAPHKGAGVVADMARYLQGNSSTKLVLIGNIDPAYDLGNDTKIHGSYEIPDIPTLIDRYKISHWFIPSIWPETFSYTTHEAIATGLPVVCFDIGAQAEAVRAAPNGRTIPIELTNKSAEAIIAAILDEQS
jgi:O-antigen biosynthesis protein